jgi:hypothetical protein
MEKISEIYKICNEIHDQIITVRQLYMNNCDHVFKRENTSYPRDNGEIWHVCVKCGHRE